MIQVHYLAIVVATVAVFIVSFIYYAILNRKVMKLRGVAPDPDRKGIRSVSMPAWKVIIEFMRNFVVGLVLAYAVFLLNLLYLNQAILMALWLWVAFPLVILVGWVIHENVSAKLAAIHAVDWLMKLLIFSVILTLWKP